MNKILYAIALLAVLTACASKKSVEHHSVRVDSTVVEKTTKTSNYTITDTSRTETGEVVITEIFFSDTEDSVTDAGISGLSLNKGTLSIGGMKGKSIRGIRQTVHGHKKENKGVSLTGSTQDATEKMTKKQKKENKKEKQSSTYHIPWWVYALGVIILSVMIFWIYAQITGRSIVPLFIRNLFKVK